MSILKNIGLTEYEIKIYETLIKIGKSDVNKLSEESKVPKTAVYPTLNSLISKNLVQKFNGAVSLFKPISPKIGIKSLISQQTKELSKVEKETISYLDRLPKLRGKQDRKEVINLSYGQPASASIYFEACKRARSSYYILGWRLKKFKDKYTFLRELKKLIRRGIDVRIISTGDREKNFELIKDYQEEGIPVRYLPLDNFSIFILDSEECKITLKDKTLDERYNVQVLDSSLAGAMNNYFLTKWEEAEEISS